MCIIVAKNKLTPLPKEDYLKNCFTNNPDGSGFMYVDNGKVIIDKGYMTYNSFKKHYDKLCKKYKNFEGKSLVMHFRIGTAGANSKENTHPYPITTSKNNLHKTYFRTNLGMAHNGVIHDYNPPTDIKDMNDTQNFIIKYVAPLYNHYEDFYKNEYILKGLDEITNSKLAFLDKYDNIYLVGTFVEDESGVKYSNSNYKPYEYTYKYYGDYYKYYDEYYYNKYKSITYKDEDFLKDEEETTSKVPAYENEILLESKWYISINEKPLEKVGNKLYIYDFYYGILYELNEYDDYEYISDKVDIFDENGEEVIF